MKLSLKKRQTKVLLAILFTLFAFAMLVGELALVYAQKIPPRVAIGPIAIGGLTREQGTLALATKAAEMANAPMLIRYQDKNWTITPNDLGVNFDVTQTVDQMFGPGTRLTYLVDGPDSRVIIKLDDEKLKKYFDTISQTIDTPAVDASLKITDSEVVALPEKIGEGIDRATLTNTLMGQISQFNTNDITLTKVTLTPKIYNDGLAEAKQQAEKLLNEQLTAKADDQQFKIGRKEIASFIVFAPTQEPILSGKGFMLATKLSDDKLKDWVKKVAKKVDQPLKDARLKLDGDKVSVFTPSQEGRTLDQDKTLVLLKSKLQSGDTQLALPIAIKKPSVTTESVNDLGIKELIGRATTSFVGSPENRKHNISNGTKFLNGILIRQGEVFSVVEQLGKIDDTTGYLPELVIRENRTTPEFGGGLCQVSTTLFRAALSSSLPIVERQNHSWRISYYERGVGPGLDATVYLPKPDLKIKNDTPGWILIQGTIEGTNLTFEFYGTKDGRRSEIIGPKLLSSTPPPPDEYIESADVPAGEVKQVEKPHPGGKTTATYRIYDSAGKQTSEQIFNSSYKASPARFVKGTGAPAPAPAPSPEPTPAPTTDTTTPTPSPATQ